MAALSALGSLATAADLKVDPERSRIQVDVKATGHNFTGDLKSYKANISGDADVLTPSAVSLTWKFTDLDTNEKDRDAEMIKWLGGKAAAGSFTMTKTWQKDGKNYIQGELSIHGVKKTISFPYTSKKEGDWVTIDGTATMNYQDFSLPLIKTMVFMTVDPELTVRIHLVGEIK